MWWFYEDIVVRYMVVVLMLGLLENENGVENIKIVIEIEGGRGELFGL